MWSRDHGERVQGWATKDIADPPNNVELFLRRRICLDGSET